MNLETDGAARSGLQPFLEVVPQPVDDRVGLGLDEDLVDDGLDAAWSPLAALAEVGLGAMAEHVGRRGTGGRLPESYPECELIEWPGNAPASSLIIMVGCAPCR
jgi:hypothetical protein